MGGPNSGRRPNLEHRRMAVELRSKGFTLKEIGMRLGVTIEGVRRMLIACGQNTRRLRPARSPRGMRWPSGR